jgi:hypothetical protein
MYIKIDQGVRPRSPARILQARHGRPQVNLIHRFLRSASSSSSG